MSATTTKGSAVMTLPSDTQILFTRTFNAPPHLVYRVLTEPEFIKRWWAGKRGAITSVEVDLRIGGTWRYSMEAEGPGMEVAFRGEYREIVPDERIVFTEIYEAGPGATNEGPRVLSTYTLTPHDGGTTLTLLTETPDKATRDAIVESGMESGVQEGMDIAEELAVELST
jgi:uncharacterized protein YndB with AHSA1/START domain